MTAIIRILALVSVFTLSGTACAAETTKQEGGAQQAPEAAAAPPAPATSEERLTESAPPLEVNTVAGAASAADAEQQQTQDATGAATTGEERSAISRSLSFSCSAANCQCKGLDDCIDLATTGLCQDKPKCGGDTCICNRK